MNQWNYIFKSFLLNTIDSFVIHLLRRRTSPLEIFLNGKFRFVITCYLFLFKKWSNSERKICRKPGVLLAITPGKLYRV